MGQETFQASRTNSILSDYKTFSYLKYFIVYVHTHVKDVLKSIFKFKDFCCCPLAKYNLRKA